MARISMRPRPPISASAAPDVPENTSEPMTLTWARPPGTRPPSVLAKRKMWLVMPAWFIRLPTKMKTGTATRGKESSA
jgi:hypothetical protein